jgi:C-terminal processing protease CtpA/Prc
VVSKIAEGGPAAKTGGLRVHDRIMKVNVKSTLNKSLTLTVISIDQGYLVDIGRMSKGQAKCLRVTISGWYRVSRNGVLCGFLVLCFIVVV